MKKEFRNSEQWRDWLEVNHGCESEIWLVISKTKHRQTKFSLDEAVEEAKKNGSWQATIERENTEEIPEDLKNALRKQKGSITAYRALNQSKKKQYLYWLETAKQEKTRKSRIDKIVEEMSIKKYLKEKKNLLDIY